MFKKTVVAGATGLTLVSVNAHAALAVAVTDSITAGVADAASLGGLVLALVVGIAIFRHIRAAK
jgi:hypothetical protein